MHYLFRVTFAPSRANLALFLTAFRVLMHRLKKQFSLDEFEPIAE